MKAVRPRLWLPTRWNLSRYTPSNRRGGMENTNSSDFGVSNSNEAIELEQESDDHMTKAIHVGPSKPKPKWTRVPHMECGLEGLSAETSTTILGKKGPTQIEEDEFNEENEAQVSGCLGFVLHDFWVSGFQGRRL
nr:hypothetical protein CFP56_44972 [Quercus suber]